MSFPMVQTCAIIFSHGCAQECEAKLDSFAAAIILHAAIFTFTELKSCPFWHPLGHIDHGLRAWRASWVRPHKHTYAKHTHMPSYSFSKEVALALWVSGCSDGTHSETLPKASVCINLDIPTPAETLSEFLPDLTHANDKAGGGRGPTGETVSRGSDQAAPPGKGVSDNLPLRQWCLADHVTLRVRGAGSAASMLRLVQVKDWSLKWNVTDLRGFKKKGTKTKTQINSRFSC